MSKPFRQGALTAALASAALAAPWLLPSFATQMAFLWLMVVFALTWDVMGGQMGYNSFGNVLFFGIGAYPGVARPLLRDRHARAGSRRGGHRGGMAVRG